MNHTFYNKCIDQYNYIQSLENSYLTITFSERNNKTVSLKEIKNIQKNLDDLNNCFETENEKNNISEFDISIFHRTKKKVEDFFKNHTVLIHFHHDAGFGNNLFIFGLKKNWEKGHALLVKNHFDWSIRIPKPKENNCYYYKIVKKYSDHRMEWQPGENRIVLSDYQEIFHHVRGPFSFPESHSEQITYDDLDENGSNENFIYTSYGEDNNNTNDTHTDLSGRSQLEVNNNSGWEPHRFSLISNTHSDHHPLSQNALAINLLVHNLLMREFLEGGLPSIETVPSQNNTNHPPTYSPVNNPGINYGVVRQNQPWHAPSIFENNTHSNHLIANNSAKTEEIILEIPGTEKYLANRIPNNITQKEKEIERLKDLFYEMDTNKPIPNNFECSIMQEIMALPLFDASHPEVQKQRLNRDVRHLMDKSNFEKLSKNNIDINEGRVFNRIPLNCPTCHHPKEKNINNNHLLIDTQLQDLILEFLQKNTEK